MPPRQPDHARGYTLVELFLTLAVLMVVFGLMINVANRVRRESTEKYARRTLSRLSVMMESYTAAHGEPAVPPLVVPGEMINERQLRSAAAMNNAAVVNLLKIKGGGGFPPLTDGLLTDPWGSPVVYMPRQNPAVGMAPSDAPFFVSAGPDRAYLTRDDNLYSYEEQTRPDPVK